MWRWLEGLIGGRPDTDGSPARLIDIPGQVREPSAELLRRLRALDPRAEVIYVGEGRWWLGRVKTDAPRRQLGRQMAVRIMQGDGFPGNRWAELRQALLMAQGFGFVLEEQCYGEPDARLERGLRLFLYAEQGGKLDEQEDAEYQRRREARAADAARRRDLARWWFRRRGRGNPWIGGVSNTSTGRMVP